MSELGGYSGRGSDAWRWEGSTMSEPRMPTSSTSQVHATDGSGPPDSSAVKAGQRAVKPWFNDPEMKRKKRIAKYKAYGVEGKVKASFRRSFRWIKRKVSIMVHGC